MDKLKRLYYNKEYRGFPLAPIISPDFLTIY
jgi:hypothetical protein